jgi:hypothetical protein
MRKLNPIVSAIEKMQRLQAALLVAQARSNEIQREIDSLLARKSSPSREKVKRKRQE